MSSSYGQLLKDLQIGVEEGERPVSKFLKATFGIKTKNVGKNNIGWDLEVSGVDAGFIKKSGKKITAQELEKKFIRKFGKTFEIKRDKASDRTNNFFYEVWSNVRVHNPGCIASSKADVFVIVRNKEFIFIDRGCFLSWITYNLYFDSDLSKKWKKKTCRRVKKTEMKNSPVSPHVRGILIPIEDIKKEACIAVFQR
jgi:hypothetical protein